MRGIWSRKRDPRVDRRQALDRKDGLHCGPLVVDITDRQHAEDFRAVVMQNVDEGIYVTDDAGSLVSMNTAASRMTGWTEEDLLGKSVHEAIHHQHADGSSYPEQDCPLVKVQTDGRKLRVAADAFTRKDGSIFPVAYSASPLLSGPKVRGVAVVFRDTTLEQAESSRAQRELDALSWVGRIRDAIDDDRLVLYSQPITALSPSAHPSEELLIRMIGPKGEVIPPASFIPVAEQYGLIGEIDQWVIKQAASLAAAGGRVFQTNLSAVSIGNLDLVSRIERELSDAGTDPANMVFELTETALMKDVEAGEEFARRIAQIGCSIALDDFGTGYGSFTYLQKLHIKFIKMDMSFVADLPNNPTNQHLVKAIVNIAQGLGQQTVAEGVEDSETLELLREYGVDLAQGFYVGRPSPLVTGALHG
jgi:PAS domain S-box-containing protein